MIGQDAKMTFTSAVLGRTGKGARAIALIGVLACALGVGVGIVIAPLATLAAVGGVVGLPALMWATKHRPVWSLAAVLFSIQLGNLWLPAWHGRRLPLSGADMLLGALLVIVILQTLTRQMAPRRSPLDVWWGLYLLVLLPSLWMTRDYLWWLAGLRIVLQSMVMFYLVFEMIDTLPQARAFSRVLAAWGGFAAFSLIYTTFTASEGYAFVLLYKLTDVSWARSNYFASFMLVLGSMSFFMAMYEKARTARWALQSLTAIMLAAMVLTKSYGAIIVGAICLVAWLVAIRRRQLVRLLGVFLLIGGIAIVGSRLYPDLFRYAIGELPVVVRNLPRERRMVNRIEIWEYNLDLFKQSPVVGHGMLNTLLYHAGARGVPPWWLEAHNYVLQTMAQNGLVGLFGFLLLWWHVGLGLIKTWRAAPQGTWQRGLMLGIIMAVAAALMHGMGEPNILERDFGMVIWAMIGMGFALGRIQGGRQIQRSGTSC